MDVHPREMKRCLKQSETNATARKILLTVERERDALQKRHARVVAALNPASNDLRLKDQAAAK